VLLNYLHFFSLFRTTVLLKHSDGVTDLSLKSDRLRGAKKIADFRGDDLRRTYYLLERKIIPAFKEGRVWVASKQALRDQYEHQAVGTRLAGTGDDAPE
jgi:hypothetical protein